MANTNDFMVSSGFNVSIAESIKELYRKAAEECDAKGWSDITILTFQVLSEEPHPGATMYYCIIASFSFA